jgi:FkbM family methyltransferase
MKPHAIAEEIARHQQAFTEVGLPWLGLGANHHCWILPTSDAQAAFRAEEASGLRFDFGWRPPTVDAAPSSDPEFALVHPFRPRDGAAAMQFVLYQPSPSPVSRERDAERMAALGLPMTFYIHSEHRMVRGTLGARELDGLIAAIDRLRQKHEAVFLTEVQMARSLIGTLAAEIRVFADDQGSLRLALDPASIPEWAAGFAGAVAVRVHRPGENGANATTDAPCFRDDSDELVTAVGASTRVRFGGPQRPRWWIERANVPLRVFDDGFEVLEPGFQQIWLRGDALQIGWRGGLVRRVARGYVLTRWGDASSASISPPRVRPTPPVIWHSGRHGLDKWVLREAFPGRTTPGFFVDVGAADGVSSSATCTLERHFGWKGIVVEPNELLFAQLRANRSAIAENACVSDRDGEVDFIEASWFGRIREHALPSLGNGDHTSDEYLRRDLDGRPSRIVKKRSLSLGSLLDKHEAPRRIDFLSIDAEGGEWFIVKALPLDRYEILALCVDTKFEWEGRLHDTPDAERIRDFLIRHGYWHDAERSRTAQRDFFLHQALHRP